MTTRPHPFITSVRIEPSDGPHEYVSIWIRGANVGTLCVGKGDGEELRALLLGEPSLLERQADASDAVGLGHLADAIRQRREQQGYAAAAAELTPWMQGALGVMRDPHPMLRFRAAPGTLDPDTACEDCDGQLIVVEHIGADTLYRCPKCNPETGDLELHVTDTPTEAEQGASAPSPPAASSEPAAGAPRSISMPPLDLRLLAVRRISRAIDASFRADEQEMLRKAGWVPPMIVDADRAREAAEAWREEETIG